MKKVVILGSTGSIGVNTLKVISQLPKNDFEVLGLSTNSRVDLLAQQIKQFRPKAICVRDPQKTKELKKLVNLKGITIFEGPLGLQEIASLKESDLVVIAVLGNASLLPLIRAIESKKSIALASKEPLVSAGRIVIEKAKKNKVQIIPIDSEHNAIFQCLKGQKTGELKKIYLTGSGGPLRKIAKRHFNGFSPERITKHPKWKMGKKISVDSATLMNKGLEAIEAKWLFGVDILDIEVLIHPEAIVHSMVELRDGSLLAQMAYPDMCLPIQFALTFPERLSSNFFTFDFKKVNKLTFHAPDKKKFPCLDIAYEAARKSGTYPAVLNAANEEVVNLYLKGMLKFTEIPKVIEKVITKHRGITQPKLKDILDTDKWAREEVKLYI